MLSPDLRNWTERKQYDTCPCIPFYPHVSRYDDPMTFNWDNMHHFLKSFTVAELKLWNIITENQKK